MRIITLKRRAEFLRVRGAARWSTSNFVLEARPRAAGDEARTNGRPGPPRFGFTVTKKLGGAVVRNRIRRRLKEALRSLKPTPAIDGLDFVLIARTGASICALDQLAADLATAIGRVSKMTKDGPDKHDPAPRRARRNRGAQGGGKVGAAGRD